MIHIASYSDMGGRPRNEDTALTRRADDESVCAVVADGLGGHGGGDQASQRAAQVICEGWAGQADPDALCALVTQAHRQVQEMQENACPMKTTAVVLALAGGRAAWAHAGDSRLYHFYNGELVFQTKDHSASQIAVTLGDITADQIRFHEDRSRVLRALGQEGELKVEAHGEELAPGRHAFLLCTDGFWEYVLEWEMEQDLRTAYDPQGWLDRMRLRLQDRATPGNDNNTAMALWLTR